MELPAPQQAVTALAAFVRDRFAEVAGTVSPLLARGTGRPDPAVLAAARQLASVIVGAAAPFAPTSYSRTRLIRQMHASGLLSADETSHVHQLLAVDSDDAGSA